MHDKIKAILPKEKDKYSHYPENGCDECGYNQALAEIHAKIPEIVALVEGEVRKCVPEKISSSCKDEECRCEYCGAQHAWNGERKLILANLEALFSNKESEALAARDKIKEILK